MVDALQRAHRLLKPGGSVIDLHPTAVDASVEVGPVRVGPVNAGDAPELVNLVLTKTLYRPP